MSIALHEFLVRQLRIEAANIDIVVDNASSQANANRNILCNALEKIQQARVAYDSAPHSPKRTLSMIRLPKSPHASAFEPPRSPIRNSTEQTPLVPTKSPSRWETSVAVAGKKSPPPRQPKRMLSSKELLISSSDPTPLSTRSTLGSNGRRFHAIVETIAALPLIDCEADNQEEPSSTYNSDDKLTSSPSPVCVRDFCPRQQSDESLLLQLNSSFDDFAVFED